MEVRGNYESRKLLHKSPAVTLTGGATTAGTKTLATISGVGNKLAGNLALMNSSVLHRKNNYSLGQTASAYPPKKLPGIKAQASVTSATKLQTIEQLQRLSTPNKKFQMLVQPQVSMFGSNRIPQKMTSMMPTTVSSQVSMVAGTDHRHQVSTGKHHSGTTTILALKKQLNSDMPSGFAGDLVAVPSGSKINDQRRKEVTKTPSSLLESHEIVVKLRPTTGVTKKQMSSRGLATLQQKRTRDVSPGGGEGGGRNDDDSYCEQTRASNSQYKSNNQLLTRSRHSQIESTFDLKCNGSMYTTAGGLINLTMPDGATAATTTTKGLRFAMPRTASQYNRPTTQQSATAASIKRAIYSGKRRADSAAANYEMAVDPDSKRKVLKKTASQFRHSMVAMTNTTQNSLIQSLNINQTGSLDKELRLLKTYVQQGRVENGDQRRASMAGRKSKRFVHRRIKSIGPSSDQQQLRSSLMGASQVSAAAGMSDFVKSEVINTAASNKEQAVVSHEIKEDDDYVGGRSSLDLDNGNKRSLLPMQIEERRFKIRCRSSYSHAARRQRRSASPEEAAAHRSRSRSSGRYRQVSPLIRNLAGKVQPPQPPVLVNRTSIKERFQQHTTLMDAKRANDQIRKHITVFDPQIEKLKQKVKDAQKNLSQLKKDNILMRQDISTYEAVAEVKLGLGNLCDKVVKTIDTRNRRLKDLHVSDTPKLENFLDSIIDDLSNAFGNQAVRVQRFAKPLVFTSDIHEMPQSVELQRHDSDGDMPTNLWKQKYHIDERREAFVKYFVMGDNDDDGGDDDDDQH